MPTNKTSVAFFDFAGCEGCQLTVIDALQTVPEILEALEIVRFREAMSEQGESYDLAFVEGSCVWTDDVKRLEEIRGKAGIVVALGACACLGGVQAMRNWSKVANPESYVYPELSEPYRIGKVKPVGELIKVDAYIPGCPIDAREFLRVVTALLMGARPDLPGFPVCRECWLEENGCLLQRAQPCLGPVTIGGCNAICPSLGVGCQGCRGLMRDPNIKALKDILLAQGMRSWEVDVELHRFFSCQLEALNIGEIEDA
jgi:sulfhydrogenase subunit delta